MTAPRVRMLDVDEAREVAREVGVPEFMADLNIFRVLLGHPRLAKHFNDFLGFLLSAEALDARLRELVIMRVAWVTGSEYEWAQHWQAGQAIFGVPGDDLAQARLGDASDRLTEADRAVLAATDEILEHGAVSDETWRRCAQHVEGGDRALLELVVAVGTWRMVSGLLRSVEVPLEDGLGAWEPDGTAPDATRVHG